jgi:hypothetical protein
MRNEELKKIMESKKDLVLKAFRNRLTLEKWDEYSPVWMYNILTDEVECISDVVCIKTMLMFGKPFVNCFLEKEDLDVYQWVSNIIDSEVSNRISENFEKEIGSFVSVKDLALGDMNCFV